MSQTELKEIGRECRFSWHVPAKRMGEIETPDTHIVKEQITYEDAQGQLITKPNLRLLTNLERSFWITSKRYQTYKDKREWSSLEEVSEQRCTQSELRARVAKALNRPWSKERLRDLSASPYLYGTDISSTSLLKKAYQNKYPSLSTPYSLCTFDIETDVVNGTEEPIMASAVMGDKIVIAVTKAYAEDQRDLERRFRELMYKYIGEYLDKRDAKIEMIVSGTAVDAIADVFKRIHSWMPDWVAIWNIDFDIPKILALFEKYNVDPKTILCDPSLPEHLKFCTYKQGPKKKVTASGKVFPINPAQQWHTLELAASFYVIDAMCTYKHIRLGEQEEPSYSLDAILSKHLGVRKLKFEEANEYEGLRWHQVMQLHYRIEYMVYNVFDSLSMIELDEKTNDLRTSLPVFSGATDFWNFKSQPKRIADQLHFYALSKGCVMGTVAPSQKAAAEDVDEEDTAEEPELDADGQNPQDYEVLNLKSWILTLPAHMSSLGLPLIQEDSTVQTNIRAFTFDSDSVSSYPTSTAIANVSRTTTKREIIKIEGIDEMVFRMQNLNVVLGQVNASEYCQTMFGMPSPQDLLKSFLDSQS